MREADGVADDEAALVGACLVVTRQRVRSALTSSIKKDAKQQSESLNVYYYVLAGRTISIFIFAVVGDGIGGTNLGSQWAWLEMRLSQIIHPTL